MYAEVHVISIDETPERIAEVTRSLLQDLRQDVNRKARLVSMPSPPEGKSGDIVSFGQIALALVTSGALTAMVTTFFTWLSLNRKFQIEIQNSKGAKISINAEYIGSHTIAEIDAILQSFLHE